MTNKNHPIQPVEMIKGVARFKENKIVSHLLDKCTEAGICDLNKIAILGKFSDEDREQLAQLIGYSVSGAGDLSYMSDRVIELACREVEKLDSIKEQEEVAISKKETTTEFDVAKMVVAKEELRADLQEWEDDCLIFINPSKKPLDRDGVVRTFRLAKNLITILDSIKEPKEEYLYSCDSCQEMKDDVILHDTPAGEGYFCDQCLTGESNKKVDIWKDVSELLEYQNYHIIGKMKTGKCVLGFPYQLVDETLTIRNMDNIGGNSENYFQSFCTLTDFINQQEQTAKRLAELELIIKGLL